MGKVLCNHQMGSRGARSYRQEPGFMLRITLHNSSQPNISRCRCSIFLFSRTHLSWFCQSLGLLETITSPRPMWWTCRSYTEPSPEWLLTKRWSSMNFLRSRTLKNVCEPGQKPISRFDHWGSFHSRRPSIPRTAYTQIENGNGRHRSSRKRASIIGMT